MTQWKDGKPGPAGTASKRTKKRAEIRKRNAVEKNDGFWANLVQPTARAVRTADTPTYNTPPLTYTIGGGTNVWRT